WEAVALFDYMARSPAELSFKQGDPIILHSKASCDWWRGEVGGVKGLVPHKYISILEGSERGKRDEGRVGGGSTGNLTAEDPLTENTTRSQERRHTLDTVRQGSCRIPDKPPFAQAERPTIDKVIYPTNLDVLLYFC
ncbi:hypothetical protein GOODEAATRI_014757, partial [Goodea atripinnis]